MYCTRFGIGVLLAAVLVAGCSSSHDGRLEISGTVKLRGEAIKDGAIVMLEPLEEQGTAANATVTGGAFSIPKSSGLKPGKYLVRITAGDGKTAVNPVDENSPPGPGGSNIISKELVPADWNVNSKQEVTVAKDGSNKFDFSIP
ncbi:MAG: carboxypeptidase regulatory-like domain-containing protein [Gemmataceae bacterium]|nr:carboxypeptidase regulatory-like domain-containing protein [Gemmataceae bacterium]